MSATLTAPVPISADKLIISPPQLCAHIGVQLQTLSNWRMLGRGPKYIRVGRLIRYRMKDVEAWLSANSK